jgi:hypothetical protein
MRKNALTICCFACAAGAIGAFCRWLQNQLAFDEAGLSKQSPLNFVVALVLIGAAVWMYFLAGKFKKAGFAAHTGLKEALGGSTRFCLPAAWIIGALMLFGGLVLFVTGEDEASPMLVRILAALSLFGGVFFPLSASAAVNGRETGVTCLFMTVPVVQFCFWLITCYKQNSTNPVLWAYAVEILAIAAALLGFYYMAGYAFGRVKPRSALYFDMLGAFLCIVSLADDGNFGEKLMFAAAASMLLFWAWMIVENLYLPEPAAPEAVPEPPEAPISEHDIPSIIEEVKSEEKQP